MTLSRSGERVASTPPGSGDTHKERGLMHYYIAREPIPKMTILTWLDRVIERLFDRPPLRHAVGFTAIAVGVLNILDMTSGVSSILSRVYRLPYPAIVACMLLVLVSGFVVTFSRSEPARVWYVPMMLYLLLTFVGYLTGALAGVNSWPFALKALFSVGLAWWLLIRVIRQDSDV